MTRIAVLDTGVLGLLTHPKGSAESHRCVKVSTQPFDEKLLNMHALAILTVGVLVRLADWVWDDRPLTEAAWYLRVYRYRRNCRCLCVPF